MVSLCKLPVRFARTSNVSQDFKKTGTLSGFEFAANNLTNEKNNYASRLPDFGLSPAEAALDFEALAIPVGQEISDIERTHPLEVAAKYQRENSDIFSRLMPNQVLFTNLSFQCEELSTESKVREFLIEKVHKDIDILDVKYVEALTASTQLPRLAYIVITMGSKRQAHLVEKTLRKHWFGDSLLKIRLQQDAKREAFDNRTIIIRDLPHDLNQRQIMEIFTEDAGALLSIELPQENVKLAKYIEERSLSGPQSPIAQEKANQFKSAQNAVKESLNLDQEYLKTIAGELGEDTLKVITDGESSEAQSVISNEKMKALIRIVTRLQAEGVQVLSQKYDLQRIRHELDFQASVSEAEHSIQENNLKAKLEINQEQIVKVMHYLRENQVTTETAANDELISDMLRMGREQLTLTFDSLILALQSREEEIERRLGQQLKHFGITERILQEGRNFDFELESLPVGYAHTLKPEQLISVNDQVNYVLQNKHMTPEEKFSRILKGALNPFADKLFNKEQLKLAEHQDLEKYTEVLDPRYHQTIIRLYREGADFKKDSEQLITELISDLRGKTDVPFDELYHREKVLVEAVIEADKALKKKQAQLVSPLQKSMIPKFEAQKVIQESIIQDDLSGAYDMGQQRTQQRLLKSKLYDESAGGFEFMNSDIQMMQDMVNSGEMSKSELDRMLQVSREQEMRNLGYCFLTFSHADEARMMLLKNPNPYCGAQKIKIDLKSNVDHSELDFEFFVDRAKQDAKLVDEIKRLREAKQELKEFEADLQNQLPNRKRLLEFKKLAKDIIENNSISTRQAASDQRNEFEEERLREKIKQLEAKYPHVDMSQLFTSEKAEDAKRSLHQNAFASFKAYQFLKHGITTSQTTQHVKSDAKRRLEELDPFNFPELDRTVAKVLSKETVVPRIIDHGEPINKPGRRFNGYTDSEFIEAYFGKDLMRNQAVDRNQDPLFSLQRSLKEKYPLSKFLKMPAVEKKQAMIADLKLSPSLESLSQDGHTPYLQDSEFSDLMKDMEQKDASDYLKNYQHPEDESRNFLNDLEQMLEKYETSREKREMQGTFDIKELAMLRTKLADEYGLRDKDWFQDLKKGKFKREKFEESTQVVGDEAEAAKFQINYDVFESQVDKKTRLVNKEYMNKLKTEPYFFEKNISSNLAQQFEEKQEQELDPKQKLKKPQLKENNKRSEEAIDPINLLEQLSQKTLLKGANNNYGGKWFANYQAGVKPSEQKPTKSAVGGRSLQDFIEEKDQEETDIYDQYQQKMNRRDENKKNPASQFTFDQDLVQPEMPRFENFFNYQAQGIHPFDKITDQVNEKLNQKEVESDFDLEQERLLYQREILGRLMGERLTPRQFEIISGQYSTSDVKMSRVKDSLNDNFLDRRDIIRLLEEHVEKVRRHKVITNEWTENESQQKLQAWIKECSDNILGPNARRMSKRDMEEVLEAVQMADNPERLLEKEYYFDETLGQSLDAHAAELKAKYPGVTVQIRRDRDGFALIKTLYNIEYKYNLEKIEAWDRDEARTELNKTLEAVMEVLLPQQPQQIIQDLSQNLEQTVSLLQGDQQKPYDLDAWTKFKIQELVSAKTQGNIEIPQFVDSLFKIANEAGYDSSKPLSKFTGTVFDDEPQKDPMEIILADRERFRAEIYEQLMKRVKKHMFLTKRQESDFVKPRVSEKLAFIGQVLSHDRSQISLEQKIGQVNQEGKDFDRKAFDQMKEEIRRNKEAKERLLNQGIPEFKAYLRF